MINIDFYKSGQSIDDAIKKLQKLKKELKKMETSVPEELAKNTSKIIQKNYDSKGFVSETDIPCDIGYEKQGKKFYAYARGKGVAYEEFGTGDVGMNNPHPSKNKYGSSLGLNAYNSGKTIRPADAASEKHGISDGLYWTYGGFYTQGIPSGNFMFNSADWLKNNYKKIVKEKVDDVVSKL